MKSLIFIISVFVFVISVIVGGLVATISYLFIGKFSITIMIVVSASIMVVLSFAYPYLLVILVTTFLSQGIVRKSVPFVGPSEGTDQGDTNGEQNKPVGKTG